MKRAIVCGGREYLDVERVYVALDALHDIEGLTLVRQGGAEGADALGAAWARERGVPVETFGADWKAHGRADGPIRNQAMLDAGVDLVVAFPGGRGTRDMVRRARKANVRLVIFA